MDDQCRISKIIEVKNCKKLLTENNKIGFEIGLINSQLLQIARCQRGQDPLP